MYWRTKSQTPASLCRKRSWSSSCRSTFTTIAMRSQDIRQAHNHELAVGVRHATLNSHGRSWGPARHTEFAGSQLRCSTPHWTHDITAGVGHGTLNSQDRGWGPARHAELTSSRLGPSTPHRTHRIAIEIWRGGGRQEEEEGGVQEYRSIRGEETNIKSNNPHLSGEE